MTPKTLTTTVDETSFPDRPHYAARWYPLLFHPTVGAEECFTIAIGARGTDGRIAVWEILDTRKLKYLFGDRAPVISEMISISIETLEAAFARQASLDGWIPPLSSFTLGPGRDALADDLDGVFRQAVRLTTALNFTLESKGHVLGEEHVDTLSNQAWARAVRDAVKKRRASLINSFDQEVRLTDSGIPQSIGFLTATYAAHFSAFNPRATSVKATVGSAQTKLWQLDQIRDAKLGLGFQIQNVELIVGYQDPTASNALNFTASCFKDALEEITEEAKRRSIVVFGATDPSIAADHLCQMSV